MAEGEDQDEAQKTEEPTHKRLEEALKKGQVVSSREINHFFMLFTLALMVFWMLPTSFKEEALTLSRLISQPELYDMDAPSVGALLQDAFGNTLLALALPLFAMVAAALTGALIQHKLTFSWEPVMPKLERLSPLKGLKRLFSKRSLVEFVKSLIKITIVGVGATYALWPELPVLKQVGTFDIAGIMETLRRMSGRLLITVVVILFFIAIIDYMYQYFEHMKSLRMTKQEIKDEYKQQEGDPVVKQRIRALRRERARKRMMAAVPTSDVVVTNPTHFAVALAYNATDMKAPRVVAKGADLIAQRIREMAKKHGVPIVENPPLARSLYDAVELDAEIPTSLYKAVAEIISYVYKLKGKMPKRT